MKTSNKILMSQARELLKGKWGEGVKVTFLYSIIIFAINSLPKIGSFISFIITGPFMLGLTYYWLTFSRRQDVKINMIFDGFNSWWRALSAYFLIILYTLLWTLLLVVPGIIAAYSYSQTFYILADDKNIRVNDAINKSKVIMKGNKWKLFCLGCRFIGWGLLCILSLGIGFLWLAPYFRVTLARFYDDINNHNSIPTPSVPLN